MRPLFFFAPAAITLTLLSMSAPVHADYQVILTNIGQQPQETATPNPFVGQSFIAGSESQTLYGAEMQLGTTTPPSPNIELEVEARNPDGTVGATLFSSFSSSFNTTTGLDTFTATSHFVLTAGTGYWLVLSDPTSSTHNVSWNFTSSNFYESNYGYGLPSFSTSFASNADNGMGNITYYDPSAGPQLFALLAPAIPEPPSYLLMIFAATTLGLARWFIGATRNSLGRKKSMASF